MDVIFSCTKSKNNFIVKYFQVFGISFLITISCASLTKSQSYYPLNGHSTGKYNDIDEDEQTNYDEEQHDPQSSYRFEYFVNSPQTEDFKAQHEERIGDIVRGSYSLVEPDGRRRTVEYTADPQHGFNAIVKHEPIDATHPHPHPHSPHLHHKMPEPGHFFAVKPSPPNVASLRQSHDELLPTIPLVSQSPIASPVSPPLYNLPPPVVPLVHPPPLRTNIKPKKLFYMLPQPLLYHPSEYSRPNQVPSALPKNSIFPRLNWPFVY